MRPLRITLTAIGFVQLALGTFFLLAPATAATMFGLEPDAPGWVNWLFAMMAARFLGYAYGMFRTARSPRPDPIWIDSMIAIQVIDWLATLGYLISGDVTLGQVTTASFLPVMFVAALLRWHPRRLDRIGGRPGHPRSNRPATAATA
jgi:hypothetical protein